MNPALIVLSLAAFTALGLGGWLILKSLRSAADGYEDETGFHLGPEPVVRVPSALRSGEGPTPSLPR